MKTELKILTAVVVIGVVIYFINRENFSSTKCDVQCADSAFYDFCVTQCMQSGYTLEGGALASSNDDYLTQPVAFDKGPTIVA